MDLDYRSNPMTSSILWHSLRISSGKKFTFIYLFIGTEHLIANSRVKQTHYLCLLRKQILVWDIKKLSTLYLKVNIDTTINPESMSIVICKIYFFGIFTIGWGIVDSYKRFKLSQMDLVTQADIFLGVAGANKGEYWPSTIIYVTLLVRIVQFLK
jgi:hypothetical protein